MANVRALDRSAVAAVAQVDTLTVGGTIETDDLFKITLTDENGNSKTLEVTAGSTVADTVAATIASAFNADTDYRFTPITAFAVGSGGQLTLTADTAGVPFYCTVTTAEAGGGAADAQTFTRAATTANAGPYDWNDANNWDTGAVPGGSASQDVYVENVTFKYGLDQSSISNTLSSLTIYNSQIGENPAAGLDPTYLQIKATEVDINWHEGPGTPSFAVPVNIDTGSTASAIVVYNSGNNSTSSAVRIKANSGSTTVKAYKGKVSIAAESGEAATVSSIDVSYVSNVGSDAAVYIGSGVTVTTVKCNGGSTVLGCAATTVTSSAGTLTTNGSGAISTLNVLGGTAYLNSSGTVATTNLTDGTVYVTDGAFTTVNNTGGVFDISRALDSMTVATYKQDPGGSVKFAPNLITFTNHIQPYSASNQNVITVTTA